MGTLECESRPERLDSQSARTMDCDDQPAIEVGMCRLPLPVIAGSKRNPEAWLGYPRGPSSKGVSRWNTCPATAVSRSPRATRPTAGEDGWGRIDADPAAQAASDPAPRIDDRIRNATAATGSGPLKPPPTPDSIVFPADSPRCDPIQDRNVSTDRCAIQHPLFRGCAGKHSTTSGRWSRLQV